MVTFLRRNPIAAYFLLTFGLSWVGALLVVIPSLVRGSEIPKLSGLLIFPAMLLGPVVGGLGMSYAVDGREGLKDVLRRMGRWRLGRWYGVLLIPPALILTILFLLRHFVSPVFAPNHFWLGIAFGVPAGLCEEIGWTGFAFPRMRARGSALSAAMVLGLLWGAWHLPAINYLGAATPHGRYWLPFFLSFTLAMTAMRTLIAWLYQNTQSLLLAQLMHISSTGALVIFSPPVSAAQESLWYGLYGCLLWLLVAVLVAVRGRNLP